MMQDASATPSAALKEVQASQSMTAASASDSYTHNFKYYYRTTTQRSGCVAVTGSESAMGTN